MTKTYQWVVVDGVKGPRGDWGVRLDLISDDAAAECQEGVLIFGDCPTKDFAEIIARQFARATGGIVIT